MQRYIAFCLIILLQFPLIMKLGVAVHWKLNQQTIAAESCINKDKPQMHCDGKCQFSKWMHSISKQEAPADTPFPHEQISKIQFNPFTSVEEATKSSVIDFKVYLAQNFASLFFSVGILTFEFFHPPD